MSFSWTVTDKDGNELLKKYGIHSQMLGLASNTSEKRPGCYSVLDLRHGFSGVPFKDQLADAARAAWSVVAEMLKLNLAECERKHCDTCTCNPVYPESWDIEQIRRFLAVPLEEIHRASGGY